MYQVSDTIHLRTGHKGPQWVQKYRSTLSLTSALDVVNANATPRPLYPSGKTRDPSYRKLGRLPGPVWTGAENLAITGIRSPDLIARSELLYLLRTDRVGFVMSVRLHSASDRTRLGYIYRNVFGCGQKQAYFYPWNYIRPQICQASLYLQKCILPRIK